MGKIKKSFSQEKHGATLSPYITWFIKTLEKLPLYQVPDHLAKFPARWPFSRGDLYHWIEVLDKFDSILDKFNLTYALKDGPQTRPFSREILLSATEEERDSIQETPSSTDTLGQWGFSDQGDRELVESILAFTTLLFENCGNRSLYNSSSHLTGLLNTTCLSLLEATLRLSYRLSQRYTASRLRQGGPMGGPFLGPVNPSCLSAHYDLSLEKVELLAQDFAHLNTTPISAVLLPSGSSNQLNGAGNENNDSADAFVYKLQQLDLSKHNDNANSLSDLFEYPQLGSEIPTLDLLQSLLSRTEAKDHDIVLHYVRVIKAVYGSADARRRILAIRLLAIANLAQIYPEDKLQDKILAHEKALPRRLQLPQVICDNLLPPGCSANVTKHIQSLAFATLESMTHHQSKSLDVCTALNIGASHGTLATCLRKAVSDITSTTQPQSQREEEEDTRWLDNLSVLLYSVPKTASRALDSLASAGIVDMLMEIVSARTAKAERIQAVALNFLSTLVNNARDPSDTVLNENSLEAISELLSYEVEHSLKLARKGQGMPEEYKTKLNDYQVSFVQQQCLRALFKFLNGLMTVNGAAVERLLRNLMDSSEVLSALRTTLSHPKVFGSNIWTGAVNIFSNFINNEPTSYNAIAEAGLPKALLETITQASIPQNPSESTVPDDPARNSVVDGILPACESIQAIPDAFGAMCLNEGGMTQLEASNALYTFFLIFTSPPHVKALNNSSGSELDHLGHTFDQLARHHPRLKPTIANVAWRAANRMARLVEAAPSTGMLQDDSPQTLPATKSPSEDVEMKDAEATPPNVDLASNTATTAYISVLSKFLASFFRNSYSCNAFAEKGGVECLLAFVTCPKPSLHSSNPRTTLSYLSRLARAMYIVAENKPHLLMPPLIATAQKYAQALEPFYNYSGPSSYLLPLLDQGGEHEVTRDVLQRRAKVINAFEPLLVLCDLIGKMFQPTRSNGPSFFVSINIADMCVRLVGCLGRILKMSLQERHHIFTNGSKDLIFLSYDSIKAKYEQLLEADGNTVVGQEAMYIASNTTFLIPNTIRDLFQSMSKVLLPRRVGAPDSYQRQTMLVLGEHIGQALVSLLDLNNSYNLGVDGVVGNWIETTKIVTLVLLAPPPSIVTSDLERTQVQTVVLQAFKDKGGLKLMGQHANILFKQSIAPQAEDESQEKCQSRQQRASAGFHKYLQLFAILVDTKAILEATQTSALQSRNDRDRENTFYFSAPQFLVELRAQVLENVMSIWNSDELEKSSSEVVRTMSNVLQTILEAHGEQGAIKEADKLHPRNKPLPKPWRWRNEAIQKLIAKDYPEELVREALYRCNDVASNAEEYCSFYFANAAVPRISVPPDNWNKLWANAGDAFSKSETYPYQQTSSDQRLDSDNPGPSQSEGVEAQPATSTTSGADVLQDVTQSSSSGVVPTDTEASSATQNISSDHSPTVTLEQLDIKRSALRENLADHCLSLLGAFDNVTFEFAALIVASVPKPSASNGPEAREDICNILLNALDSYQEDDDLQNDAKKITAIAHLMGIIIQEKSFFEAAQESLKDLFPNLLRFLSVSRGENWMQQAPWIPQILLIMEPTLAVDVQPNQIRWEPPNPEHPMGKQSIVSIPEPLVSHEIRVDLFNRIMEMLPRIGKNLELGLAVVRVLVVLTRSRPIATAMAQKINIQKFLVMIKQLAPSMDRKLRGPVMLIFRHIIEDDEIIRHLMRSEIRKAFQWTTRSLDTTQYTKNQYHLVLRAPEIFVEVTNELLELTKFDRNQNPQSLQLKKSVTETPEETVQASEARIDQDDVLPSAEIKEPGADSLRASDLKSPIVEKPDGVIHFLLCELLAYKDVEDKQLPSLVSTANDNSATFSSSDTEMASAEPLSTTPSDVTSDTTWSDQKLEEQVKFKVDEHPIFIYRCFILHCLSELLSSYNRCKIEFINFSRKADPQASTPTKPRSGVLSYLLNVLLPVGEIQPQFDDASKKKSATSLWAINVVVALCSRTSEHGTSRYGSEAEDEDSDLQFVRRFVLEHALKAFKEANSSTESSESKYSKILAIADLFNRLLAPKHGPSIDRRNDRADDNLIPSQKQVAKIMFEKNFIASLTQAMSEVDLSMAGANRVVKYILKPLKLLTHTAVELSITSELPALRGGDAEEHGEISSASSVTDDNDREETPDLYRNSTLGILEPGRDEESSSESDEDEEDEDEMYADEFEEEMDYEDPDPNDGEIVSDEDEEMDDDMGPVEGLSGDMGMNIEVEIEGDGDSEDEEDEDNDDDVDVEDEDEASDEDDNEDLDEDHDEDDEIEMMEEVTGDDENDSLADPHDEDGEWQETQPNDVLGAFDFETFADGEDAEAEAEMLDMLRMGPPASMLSARALGTNQGGPGSSRPFGIVESHSEADPNEQEGETGININQPPHIHFDAEDPINEELIAEISAEEDEEDEEDYGDEDVVYREFPDAEEPLLPQFPPSMLSGARRIARFPDGTIPAPPHGEPFMSPPDFWSNRPRVGGNGGNGIANDGLNPLLDRSRHSAATSSGRPAGNANTHVSDSEQFRTFSGGPLRPPPPPDQGFDLEFLSGARHWLSGTHSYISTLIDALRRHDSPGPMNQLMNQGGGTFAVSFGNSRPGGNAPGPADVLEVVLSGPGPGMPNHRHHHPHHHHHHHSRHRHPPNRQQGQSPSSPDPSQAVSFNSVHTMERWQEEARLIFGSLYMEKSSRVINSILRLLVPPAMEAERIRKEKAAEEAKKKEEERARLEAEKAEREAQEKREREEQEARDRAEAEAAAALNNEQTGNDSVDVMEGVETEAQIDQASSSADAVERVYATIRGNQVDITHLGIDQSFLEALPEEMQEEVIAQRAATQRSQAAAAGDDPSGMFTDFLAALPPEMQQDIRHHEAHERRRRDREEQRRRTVVSSGQPAQAEEMDTASFMASLDPALRQSVLADVDEETLATLPPDIAAEARALGSVSRRHMSRFDPDIDQLDLMNRRQALASRRAQQLSGIGAMSREARDARKGPRRPIIQMIDKAGIATLLRLMFMSFQSTGRSSLNNILRNGCGNHQVRGEIIFGLLSILQDASDDPSHIEESFAQLTQRAKKTAAPKALQPNKKSPTNPGLPEDVTSSVVLGNCLSSLSFLTRSIPNVPKFFLSEHDISTGFKSRFKGKGKAKETTAANFPVNSLLSLLNMDAVQKETHVMEQIAELLHNITRPLSTLLRKESDEPKQDSEQPSGQTADAADAPDATAQSGQAEAQPVPESGIVANGNGENAAGKGEANQEPKKSFPPPEIPDDNLRLVVNIITARDCGAATFSDTMATIINLSYIPNARRIIGQELVERARQFGQTIRADLDKLLKDMKSSSGEIEAQSVALATFSPTSSDQAKLNRVVLALDYLFDPKSVEYKHLPNKEVEALQDDGDQLLNGLYEDSTFSSIWSELSNCLSATQEALTKTQQSTKQIEQYFLHIATVLLPLFESLMVACQRLSLREARMANISQGASAPTTPAVDSVMKNIFFTFTNRHKKVLNDLVRHNPRLMSGSFSVLVKNSSVLEFDNKRNYFNKRLRHRTPEMRQYPHPSLALNLRRERAFEESFVHMNYKKAEEIKYGKLNVRFQGEEGVDAGGVTREWFQVLARQMFDPNNALFNPVASDKTTFHPNPLSEINDLHLKYFRFIGRFIGKALYEGRVLDCHFSRAVYKRMLSKSVTMKDMETIDLDYTKSLRWMLENDITDIITETFSTTNDKFGIIEVIDLCENGRNITVTEENKHEYVRLMVEYKLTGSVEDQLGEFLKGFHEIVPAELISIFDEGELELLISGMPEIDIDDWRANTDYSNYNSSSPQIQWFWRAVRSFDKEERAKLLQFVTGTGRVPLNGFKELEGMNGFTRFNIHKDYGNKDRLPSSHTCFNQLDLPEYDSYESLRKTLYTAITTGGEYFGFA